MSRFFGLQIEPSAQSAFQHDYWEEFTKVNDTFAHEPDINVVRVSSKKSAKKKKNDGDDAAASKSERFRKFFRDKAGTAKGLVFKSKKAENEKPCESGDISEQEKPINLHNRIYPDVPADYVPRSENIHHDDIRKALQSPSSDTQEEDEEEAEYVSVAVQTDMSYLRDVEEVLPYSCCFCCRSTTPCVVWAFVAISLIFFKMGAIVTGRWIYLSNSSFDEIVFYIAFTVCLMFATFYFRHGTKYHNPFDLMFLVLTIPIMWGLLAFTTFFLKKDIFFYVGSVIYTIFVLPYIAMGIYIAYRFWSSGKLFLRRVEGDRALEPLCRKLFFATSLMIFDGQLSICASIISMSTTVNYQEIKHVWISSLIFGPISICITLVWIIVGYFAMRNESKILTWLFTLLSANQIILIVGMLLKRPRAPGSQYLFVNVAMVFSSTIVLSIHICLLVVLWNWIVPFYGKGLKRAVRRTSNNNCIQCAQLTICR
ncbi:unnamed protein product [Orchesella dallaii]|uniref:DUF7789 domain-containing protein n=1 Tax=Orchesella dallaii TaxID=48710 RepID=A0ABP1Q240_9HEXA